MTDDLRDHLRGMADSAAARTSDLDTGRLVEFVGAARRRRDQRQRVAVGGLALALVGGVAYGGMQIFGGDDRPVVAVTGPSDNEYCGMSIGASETNYPTGDTQSQSRVAVISYDDSYSNTEPDIMFAGGDRRAVTTVDGLNLTLFNDTDFTFEADSVWIDVYVARGNEVIAAPLWDTSDADAVDLSLPPGEIATVPIRSPLMCAGQSMDGDGVLAVFAIASGTFTGADGDVETWRATFDDTSRMTGIGFSSLTGGDGPSPDYSADIWLWGGAWTVSELTDIPELPGPKREVSSEFPGWQDAQCGDVFPIMRHAGKEPRLVATDTRLDLPETVRGREYGYEYSGLGLGPDDVSGTRAAAAVWLLNPKDGEHIAGSSTGYVSTIVVRDGLVVGTYGDMLDPSAAFNLDPGYAVQLKITGAGNCEGFGDKVLDTDEVYYVLDAQLGDDFRDRTLIWGGPWTLRDPALPDPLPTEPQPDPQPSPTPSLDLEARSIEEIEAMGYARLNSTCQMNYAEGLDGPVELTCPLVVWAALEGKSLTPSQLNDEVFYFSLATGDEVGLVRLETEAHAWLNIGLGTGGDGMVAPSLRLGFASLESIRHGMAYPAVIDISNPRWQVVQPLVFGDELTTINLEFDDVRSIGGQHIDGSSLTMVSDMVSFQILQENPGWEADGHILDAACQPYERLDDQSITFADDTVDCPVDFIIPPELTEQPQTLESLQNLVVGLTLPDGADSTHVLLVERVEAIIEFDGDLVFPPIVGDFDSLPIHQRAFELNRDTPLHEIGMYYGFMTTDSGSLPAGDVTVRFALNLEQVRLEEADVESPSSSYRLLTSPITIRTTS